MNISNLTYYSTQEERFNVLSHALGILLSCIGLYLLINRSLEEKSLTKLLSFSIFGISMLLVYTASTLYHYIQSPVWRKRMNILDHTCIYLLIAGTYTPFTLLALEQQSGLIILSVIWSMAVLGSIFKLFFTGRYTTLSTIFYMIMGWMVLFVYGPLSEALSTPGLIWLALGGAFYSIGALFFSLSKIKFNHGIFHIFVLLGSFSHFISIYQYL